MLTYIERNIFDNKPKSDVTLTNTWFTFLSLKNIYKLKLSLNLN